jgi:predicted DNA-binding protein with PD1-like motif
MQSKQLDTGEHDKTHILVFDIGDEAMGGLLEFAREHNITSAHFTAIGAFSDATLA